MNVIVDIVDYNNNKVMIKFNKLTDYQSEIQVNCQTIGKLERVANEFYHIEILYDYEITVPVKDKRLVVGLIERIYKRHLAREARKRKPLKRYNEFKIKE